MHSKSNKIYNYNCTRNEFFLNGMKMKRKKEDIEKLLLSIFPRLYRRLFKGRNY